MMKIIPFSVSPKASEYRQRAEEHHAIAKSATDNDQRERNEVIAAAYLSLAQTEEWLAGARAHPVQDGGERTPTTKWAQS